MTYHACIYIYIYIQRQTLTYYKNEDKELHMVTTCIENVYRIIYIFDKFCTCK